MSEHQVARPAPIDDATFLRRVSLDLVGLLPTVEQLDQFLADPAADKRDRKIDELLNDRIAYADHWLSFFNDLLRNDYSGTGFITGGRKQVSQWLYRSLLNNMPFDQMTRELIAPPTVESRGYIDGIKWRGEVSAGQTLEIQFAQSISQSFLGINMKCASCHDSFIDRWTLEDAYGLAAIYSQRPLELHRCDKPNGQMATPTWLFPQLGQVDADAPPETRLKQLADLMTHKDNGRFARTIVNRLWHRMMGYGVVHPLDAMQHEPWNADLLDHLAFDFVENGFDLKHTLRYIATSQAYQSTTEVVDPKLQTESYVYRGPRARRMTAEQFLDALWQLTGNSPMKFDAPVVRVLLSDEELEQIELQGSWIWGPLTDGSVPAGEEIVLRKTFELTDPAQSGSAMITCDNEYRMYLNNRLISEGTDWTRPQTVLMTQQLKKGSNTIAVIAKNAGGSPNPAGLYFQASLQFEDGSRQTLVTDESWQVNKAVPPQREGRLGGMTKDDWQPVTIVTPVDAWTQVVNTEGKLALARASAGMDQAPMIRASLMKNTALMKSLGRPMREQIVSMRPTSVTTLEAIDLANEPSLAENFFQGAERILGQPHESTSELVTFMFRSALSREPTESEKSLFLEVLGEEPTQAAIADALWAICMLPEFLLVR
ncbi:MAG: DUF1553 domain-containing protein [Pirellulaceae bacterium]